MSRTDDPRETHICNEDCPPVGVAGAVPTGQRMLPAIARPMVIGRHVYGRSPSGGLNCVCGWTGHPTLNRDAAYAAWEAHATAPEPRVVDVDSLATDEDAPEAVVLAAARADSISRFSYSAAYVSEEAREQHIANDAASTAAEFDFRAAINAGWRAARTLLLAELADAHRCAGADYTVRMEYFAERKQALAERDAARAEADSDRRAYLVQVERLIAERNAARAEAERIAQDYDVLKREYEDKVPPTARAAGKNRPKEADGD